MAEPEAVATPGEGAGPDPSTTSVSQRLAKAEEDLARVRRDVDSALSVVDTLGSTLDTLEGILTRNPDADGDDLADGLKDLSLSQQSFKFNMLTPEALRLARLDAAQEHRAAGRFETQLEQRGMDRSEAKDAIKEASPRPVSLTSVMSGCDRSPRFKSPGAAPSMAALASPKLEEVLQGVLKADPQSNEFLSSVKDVRKALSVESNPPVQEVVNAGVVPRLVSSLRLNVPQNTKFEILWALTNIASGTHEQTQFVVEQGAVEVCLEILRSAESSSDLLEQAVWALGNIAGDSPELRDVVLEKGAVDAVLALVSGDAVVASIALRRNCTWTLSNFCRGKNPKPPRAVIRPILPHVARLLHDTDDEVVTDACWALTYASDGPNDHIQEVLALGVVRRLVDLLGWPNAAVVTGALRAVGNIVTGDDMQTQIVLNSDVLPALARLLEHGKQTIRKEAAWALSNITAGNRDQIALVVNTEGILEKIINSSLVGDFKLKKEALWALCNLFSGSDRETVARVFSMPNCAEVLIGALQMPDPRVIEIALEALDAALTADPSREGEGHYFAQRVEEAGGLDCIESLQEHDSERVYQLAVRILETHYDAETYEPGLPAKAAAKLS